MKQQLPDEEAERTCARLAAARARGERARKRFLKAEGGMLPAEALAARLGTSPDAVEAQRRSGNLLAIAVGQAYQYPAWQLAGDRVLPGLLDVLADLGAHDPWSKLAFFLSRNSYLDGATPLAELRRGRLDAVRRAARAHGEQGAA